MNRRILYTSVLSIVIAMALSVLLDTIFPPTPKEAIPLTDQGLEKTQDSASPEKVSSFTWASTGEAQEVTFETESLEGTFSTVNASLKSLSFKNFKNEKHERTELIDLDSLGLFSEALTISGQTLPESIPYDLVSSDNNQFVFQSKLKLDGRPFTW